jgi:hypothetical protein
MSISVLVISDIAHFLRMKDVWDQSLRDRSANPLLCSCILAEHFKLSQRLGWHPFLFVFLSGGRLIGFAPLVTRLRFGFRQVCSLNQFVYPDFFVDDYREICTNSLIGFLFERLNCESLEITFEDGSVNQGVLESVCNERGLYFHRVPAEGEAIVVADISLESFRSFLGGGRRKKFNRIARKVAAKGSWRIFGVEPDSNSLEKIWQIEKHSWKSNLKGKDKAIKNWDLSHFLCGVQRNNKNDSLFESKIWFLELDNVPISYQLIMKRNRTAYFIKTSYDSRFSEISPGIFLINDLVERVFREQTIDKISFVSNQPFVKDWKPTVRKRTTVKIEQNPRVSIIWRFLFENRLSQRSTNFFEYLKWKRLYP